jgi:ATP-dependent Clp protease ATP-binding subunit ClpA
MKERVQEEMKRFFRPEFLNRIDATVVFQPLNKSEIRQIVELELVGMRKQLASREITLVVTDQAKDHIASVGYDSNFGARPLARSIQNAIADPLAEMLLQGKFHAGDTVRVHLLEGQLTIEKAVAEEGTPEPVAP